MLHDWDELGASVWCLVVATICLSDQVKSILNKLKLAAAVNRHHRSCENICIANLSMFSSFAWHVQMWIFCKSQVRKYN